MQTSYLQMLLLQEEQTFTKILSCISNFEDTKMKEARIRQQTEIHPIQIEQCNQRLAQREKKYRKIFGKNNALQKKWLN